MHSQVGAASWDESIPAVAFDQFDGDVHNWNPASKINHSGTTSVTRISGNTVNIPISISATMTTSNNLQFVNYFVKGVGLSLRASAQGNVAGQGTSVAAVAISATATSLNPSNSLFLSNSTSSSDSLASSSASVSGTPPPPSPSLSGLPAPQWISGSWVYSTDATSLSASNEGANGTGSSSSTPNMLSAVVAGIAVALTLVILLLLLIPFLIYRKRKKARRVIGIEPFQKSSTTPEERAIASRHSSASYSRGSRAASVAVTVQDASKKEAQSSAYELSPHTPDVRESQVALLANTQWVPPPPSYTISISESQRASPMPLPDWTLADEPADSAHPFSTRCSSILTGMAYDMSPLNGPGEVGRPGDFCVSSPSPLTSTGAPMDDQVRFDDSPIIKSPMPGNPLGSTPKVRVTREDADLSFPTGT
ncbi:hypothetical protein M408DRAFT_196641 [Serendipita vermifera MAFF 305830]|uniref:Uncharacterized protein n=1 Tax=Serendipita vermifera MAFF 305830 TaxID=933852 RepID=A0A0C3ANJ7_SERVB|nr:hypothetical protein M408DRAFT_196641 [Serendipita vermifera MAFF 305830]